MLKCFSRDFLTRLKEEHNIFFAIGFTTTNSDAMIAMPWIVKQITEKKVLCPLRFSYKYDQLGVRAIWRDFEFATRRNRIHSVQSQKLLCFCCCRETLFLLLMLFVWPNLWTDEWKCENILTLMETRFGKFAHTSRYTGCCWFLFMYFHSTYVWHVNIHRVLYWHFPWISSHILNVSDIFGRFFDDVIFALNWVHIGFVVLLFSTQNREEYEKKRNPHESIKGNWINKLQLNTSKSKRKAKRNNNINNRKMKQDGTPEQYEYW